jgi:hypothetical protein
MYTENKWTIVFPDEEDRTRRADGLHIGGLHIPQTPLRIAAGVAVGVAAVPLMSMAAAAMVPAAMSTFGTVVAGVGTMHASFAAGGVAATLQVGSVALATTEAVAAGGALGGAAMGAASFLGRGSKKSNPENGNDDTTHIEDDTDAQEEEEDEDHDLNGPGQAPKRQSQ